MKLIESYQGLFFWVVLEYVKQAENFEAGHPNTFPDICGRYQNCNHSLDSETKIQGFVPAFFEPKR